MILPFSQVDGLRTDMVRSRGPFLEKWRNTAAYLSPRRFNDNTYARNRGEAKEQKIINNIARRSLRTFVSGMMNGSTSRARPWFKLTTLDEKRANNSMVKRYFTDVEKVFNSHFQASNLYRILPMAYKDVGVFSNAAYAMLPHPRYGVQFLPFTIGSYGFASDSEGNTNTFFRDFTMSVRQVVERYGELKATGQIDWSKMDPYVVEAWNNARYQDEVTLTNVVIPNPKPNLKSGLSHDKLYQSYTYIQQAAGGIPNQYNRGFRNEAAVYSGNSEARDYISVKGFDYFPVITPRWEVAAEEDYGDEGPGEIAFADVKTLQELERGRLNAIDKILRPPMVGPAALRRHQASILAGGITYLDEGAGDKQFRPAFQVEPRVVELIGAKSDYEEAIKSAFYEDLFLMLSNERTVSHVTARQIEEQAAEKLSALGPVMGQLDQDQNRRLIDNAFLLLKDKLPPRPKELGDEDIRPEYISILAQAQKVSLISSAEKFIGFTANTAQAFQDPSLLQLVNSEQVVRLYADYLGIDPSLVRSEKEFEDIKKIFAQRQEQAQQRAAMEQSSNTAKNMSQAKIEDTNLLGYLENASRI